jgi:hypothetical protein
MIFPSEEKEKTSLRLKLIDTWTVQEFNELLTRLVSAYESVERCETLLTLVAAEQYGSNAQDRGSNDGTWTNLFSVPARYYEGREPFWPRLTDLLESVGPFSIPLTIDAVKIASPGWLQILGSFNPLKTAADFITSYRAENTKRMELSEHVGLEREKMRAKFATDILRMLPHEQRWEGALRLPEVVRTVIEPAISNLEIVARDHRLKSAEIVRPGWALPAGEDDSPTPPTGRKFKEGL